MLARVRLPLACLSAALCGCSLVSLSGLDEGSGGSTVSSQATGGGVPASSSTGEGGSAGAGGSGPTGACVPSLFHVSFDEESTELWSPTLFEVIPTWASARTTEPTRRGAGAWAIDLAEDVKTTRLQHSLWFQPDVDYWFGFSQLYVTPALGDGSTTLFAIQCAVDPWTTVFRLRMEPSAPGLPFAATSFGVSSSDAMSSLGEVVPSSGFHDWVVHFVLSTSGEGLYEVFLGGELVYRATGASLPDGCGNRVAVRVGIERSTTNSTPAQSQVLDELRLLRGDHSEEDALYTLWPDSACP